MQHPEYFLLRIINPSELQNEFIMLPVTQNNPKIQNMRFLALTTLQIPRSVNSNVEGI